jgi:hypothetical protein
MAVAKPALAKTPPALDGRRTVIAGKLDGHEGGRLMAHNGGRTQTNVNLRGDGYSLTGIYCNLLDCSHQEPFTLRSTSWNETKYPGDAGDFVDQTTGALLQPPTGYRWGTVWMCGIWGKNDDRWVISWTGNADVEMSPRQYNSQTGNVWPDGSGLEYMAAESTPGRKVYRLYGLNPVTRADGPPTRWRDTGKSGFCGIGLIVNFFVTSQTGTVSNLYIYRLVDEPRVQQGKLFTQEFLNTLNGQGMLRFMDTFEVNHGIAHAHPDHVAPDGWATGLLHLYRGKTDTTRPVTRLGPNYWDVTPRAGYPNIVNGLSLRLEFDFEYVVARVLSKGATTTLQITNHGFQNGQMLQRVLAWYFDGRNVTPEWNGGTFPPLMPDRSGPPADTLYGAAGTETGLRNTWPITVIDTSTVSIPYDTTSDTQVVVGADYYFMAAPRIKYGSQTVYMHIGDGNHHSYNNWLGGVPSNIIGVINSYAANNPTHAGFFSIPPGRDATYATFLYDSRIVRHPRYMLELCNEVNAHFWVNVPVHATDALIDFYADYLRDNLNPGLATMWEYGNENWNTALGGYWNLEYLAKRSAWGYPSNSVQHSFWFGPAAGTGTKRMMKRVQNRYAGSGRTYWGYIGMQGSGWEIAADRGFFSLDDQFGTGTDRPIDNVHSIGGAPYTGFSGDVSTPGLKEAIKAFKDDIRPWGQKTNGLDYLRQKFVDTGKSNLAGYGPGGHISAQVAKYPWLKMAQYEGGHHSSWRSFSSGFDGSAGALGVTENDVIEFYWEYRHSQQMADQIKALYDNYTALNPNCEWPSQYTHFGVIDNPFSIPDHQSWWQLNLVYSPDWPTIVIPAGVEQRTWNA